MRETHLSQTALARLSDGVSAEAAEHLCRCAHCRSDAADYTWLEGELADTLITAAHTVTLRPKWWVVRERVLAGQRRRDVRLRLSAAASVALVFCMILVASPVLGLGTVAVAQTARMQLAPHPLGVAIAPHVTCANVSMATPTPVYRAEMTPLPTPAPVLPPTPPSSEL